MGESISKTIFSNQERQEFGLRLRKETLALKKMLDSRSFPYVEKTMLGLEVEAWLVDQNQLPCPENKEFLKNCSDKNIVEELSKFNFEVNTDPVFIEKNCFSALHKKLEVTWKDCNRSAEAIGLRPMIVGIHPMLKLSMLNLDNMSDGDRYSSLNQQVVKLRGGEPVAVDIQGKDHFQTQLTDIMLEAAATSVQVHIQANQENIKRVYNASLLASIPSVAIAANSPFLYGNSLWEETRIPLFEQCLRLACFRDKKGMDIGRVTFGTGYIRNSLMEIFLENLDGYPVLVPALFDDKVEHLRHLCFHNGTLWRWNRPIIGGVREGAPSLRVEQRVMASGPSLIDIVSNVAFSVGLTLYFAGQEKAPEESMTFTDCRNNFYEAAKNGLNGQVHWFGRRMNLSEVILEDLLPKAKEALTIMGLDKDEVSFYLDDVIRSRVLSGQNGACWQRAFVEVHGPDFQALSELYQERQESGEPVHLWKI